MFKTASCLKKILLLHSFHLDFRNPPLFWLDLHHELLCQEVILIQPYLHLPSTRERGNAWSRIADSLNSTDNPKFYINQRSV